MTVFACAMDRLLDQAATLLQERRQSHSLWRRLLRGLRRALLILTLAYALALCVLLLCMNAWGEGNWLISILLFAPGQLWLLPLAALTPTCLLFSPRQALVHLGCIVLVLVVYMDLRWSRHKPARPGQRTLTVVSNNVAQNNRQSIQGFLDRMDPDVFVVQAAPRRAGRYRRRFADRTVVSQGEFVVISRFPVRPDGLIVTADGQAVAGWFEIDFHGLPVRLLSVHLPTPRPDLEKVKSPTGLVKELLRPVLRAGESSPSGYRAGLARRAAAADLVAEQMRSAPATAIAAGDFNTPAHGRFYAAFRGAMGDAFRERGRGYGFTFPGWNHNPLVFFGPWLRLDYIFRGRRWQVQAMWTEPRRKSQHRAVAARLVLP